MSKTFYIMLSFGTIGLLVGVWFYNSTVTLLDRPFFLSGDSEIIVATRVDWMCNCADFVDTTKYKTNPVTEPADNNFFFIESSQPDQRWNRDHFIKNKYVRLTGQFYIDKGIPKEFELGHIEDKPDHARVFRFDKIEYLDEAQPFKTKSISHAVVCN
jgi:hypothetical protein